MSTFYVNKEAAVEYKEKATTCAEIFAEWMEPYEELDWYLTQKQIDEVTEAIRKEFPGVEVATTERGGGTIIMVPINDLYFVGMNVECAMCYSRQVAETLVDCWHHDDNEVGVGDLPTSPPELATIFFERNKEGQIELNVWTRQKR